MKRVMLFGGFLGLLMLKFLNINFSRPPAVALSYQPAMRLKEVPAFEVEQAAAAEVIPDEPAQVIIPRIQLNEKIFAVGLTDEKIVYTPDANVGWFMGGVRPGFKGTAALNGHFRNADGRPGVFNRLSEVRVGDEIEVIDKQQRRYVYQVAKTELVGVGDFPLQEVYGQSDRARLTLTTCAGSYNPKTKDYSDRTIIYAELMN